MNILGISGSLRRESYNTKLLRYAQTVLPEGVSLHLATLNDIPLYDDDVYQQGFPEAVAHLRERIRAADGLLIATPEYNYSIPGVLKNSLDWVSRAPDQPMKGKAVAILSATGGFAGGPRAQYALRLVLAALQARTYAGNEVFVGNASEKFDATGILIDPRAQAGVKGLLEHFHAEWKAWRGPLDA